MLVGPPNTPNLPVRPRPEDGIGGIYRYLVTLEESIQVFVSTMAGTTVGMIGVRGLSATGTRAENFTRVALPVGGQTNVMWSLTNTEPDMTYMVLSSPSSPSVLLSSMTKSTTGVLLHFAGVVPSGALIDLVLLR